jgi:endonuclease/exonuclease/phosphatase family metal-dependent hydrolase
VELTVLTWNIFHARDGHPGARADRRSTACGTPVEGAGALHLNRKLDMPMARVIARVAPDIAALQEVPTAAVIGLARRTGMSALWVTTGPAIGPRGPRDRLARANPDLWRSREGNANVLLIGPRLRAIPGTGLARTLNDLGTMAATLNRARPPWREAAHWLVERRGIVAATLSADGGPALHVGCVHLHNSFVPDLARAEARRAAAAMDGPAATPAGLILGDLNARPGHAAHAALLAAGWDDAASGDGIDRILHRGVDVIAPPRPLPDGERTVLAPHRGRWHPVLLSDHAPVVARVRLRGVGGDDRRRG